MKTKHTQIAIIGAGPAGSVAAAFLAQKGYQVTIFEAQKFPRFSIGESLLPRCMTILQEVNLLPAVEQRGYLKKYGALFLQGDHREQFRFSEQFTGGFSHTWQVPRDDFDLTLVEATKQWQVEVLYEYRVLSVTINSSTTDGSPTLIVEGPDGPIDVRCQKLIDASGFGRVLPRLLGIDRPSSQPPRMAFFSHVYHDDRPSGIAEGDIWITVHPMGAWGWTIPFSNGKTSVGIVSSPAFFDQFDGQGEEKFRAIIAADPNMATRLKHMELAFEPRTLSHYSASVSQYWGPNYCLVGNATEFLDPVFSSGVTLAIESAHAAAKLIDRELKGESVDWDHDYVNYMTLGIDAFRSYVNAWYDGTLLQIFFHTKPEATYKAQICSVLAGQVWDTTNPFVRNSETRLKQVHQLVMSQ